MYVIDGNKVQAIRESKFMSKYELAKLADISAIALSRIERGTRNAQAKTIRKLANALDVTPDALLAPVGAESTITTPIPATMRASPSRDAPSLEALMDQANRALEELTDAQARQVFDAHRADPLKNHLRLAVQYALQDRLGERAPRDRPEDRLTADTVDAWVADGTNTIEDETFRIENDLPR